MNSPASRGAACGMRLGLMLEYQKSPDPHTACRAATAVGSRGHAKDDAGKARGCMRDGVNMRTRMLNPGTHAPSGLAQTSNMERSS
jgi:hypothetical protein